MTRSVESPDSPTAWFPAMGKSRPSNCGITVSAKCRNRIGADYRWSIFDFLTTLRGIARALSRVPRTLSPMLIKHRLSSLAIRFHIYLYIYILSYNVYFLFFFSFLSIYFVKIKGSRGNFWQNFFFNSIYSVKIGNRGIERELVINFGEVFFVQTREDSLKVIRFIKRAYNVHFL